MTKALSLAILLLFLYSSAFCDVRKRSVPACLPVSCLGAGLILRIAAGAGTLPLLLAGFLPGGLVLLAGRLSKEAVGYGDGAMLFSVGAYLTFWNSLLLTLCSLLLAAVGAGILLAAKKIRRKTAIPFLPFLLTGYVVLLAGGGF